MAAAVARSIQGRCPAEAPPSCHFCQQPNSHARYACCRRSLGKQKEQHGSVACLTTLSTTWRLPHTTTTTAILMTNSTTRPHMQPRATCDGAVAACMCALQREDVLWDASVRKTPRVDHNSVQNKTLNEWERDQNFE